MESNLHTISNKHNLSIANKFINDDEPTIAGYTNPNDDIFLQPLKQ